MKRLLCIVSVFWLLCAAGQGTADRQVTVTFLGDCTIGCTETMQNAQNGFAQTAAREGYGYFFRRVLPLLSADDITVANLEGVLQETPDGKAEKSYAFRGLPEYARILTLGSVEAVSMANNHADDYGDAGRQATREALQAEGIAYFDSETPYIYEKDGVRIAFLGVWQWCGSGDWQRYAASITGLKESGADAVVVYMHTGGEYAAYHLQGQAEAAHCFIRAGADLVVGAHPHVVQGAEVYEDRLILYSLGNFVFGGNAAARMPETIIPRAVLSFSDGGEFLGLTLRLYPARISGGAVINDYQPRLVQGEEAGAVYALFDRDTAPSGAPTLQTQTDAYREYRRIPAAGY